MKFAHFIYLIAFGFLMAQCQPSSESESILEQVRPLQLPDSLSSRRIEFVLELRERVAEKAWKGFADRRSEGTFIYFNGENSEVFFPSSQVLDRLDTFVSFSQDYVLSPRTDSIPYHFELMISFDSSDRAKMYFDHPIQQFLSVEETEGYIPSVSSTEMWTTMVIHEMFHHFQYNNTAFKTYARDEIGILPFDVRDLIQLCESEPKYLQSVRIENQLLMQAIDATSTSERNAYIQDYLLARSTRINEYGRVHPHLEKVENYYIIQEGSARYMEYQCMLVLNELSTDTTAMEILEDPRFSNYQEFKSIDLTDDAFSYLTYAGAYDYHYSIGFNTLRLLDILDIEYREQLLEKPELALHHYLESYLQAPKAE